MNEDRPLAKVTLEDLLRVKRAEQPPAEFWTKFEQQLRAKQLAAIVDRKPWWREFPRAFTRLSRFQVPLGATAVLALTFITVREYREPASVSPYAPHPAEALAEPAAIAPPSDVDTFSAIPTPDEQSAELAASTTSAPAVGSAVASTTTRAGNGPRSLNTMIPWVGDALPSAAPESPSARSIAANLAAAETESDFAIVLDQGAGKGFEARAIPAKAVVSEPLAHIASPRDARRARLLAAMADAGDLKTVDSSGAARSRDRLTSRLNEQQLYDSVSRLGLGGDRLILKF